MIIRKPNTYTLKKLSVLLIVLLILFLRLSVTSGKTIDTPSNPDDSYFMLSLGFPVGFMDNKQIDNKFALKIGSVRFLFRPPGSRKILWGPGLSFTSFFHKEHSGLLLNILSLNAAIQYYPDKIGQGVYLTGNFGLTQAYISNGFDLAASSPVSFGISAGAGFRIPFTNKKNSMVFEILYNYTAVKNHIHIISLNIGLML
ncbi:MAG: hypothetical protein KAS64_02330 [Spirochaetes bacterium]|nr:hypothetical protein [Spirochaetota bacterium]